MQDKVTKCCNNSPWLCQIKATFSFKIQRIKILILVKYMKDYTIAQEVMRGVKIITLIN